jgi:hypothetical protein
MKTSAIGGSRFRGIIVARRGIRECHDATAVEPIAMDSSGLRSESGFVQDVILNAALVRRTPGRPQ